MPIFRLLKRGPAPAAPSQAVGYREERFPAAAFQEADSQEAVFRILRRQWRLARHHFRRQRLT